MTAVALLPPHEATPANPKWHELRRAGISASEIAAVMGLSPWGSPFSCYWAKTEGWDTESNADMTAGRYAEAAICQWYADECDPLENLLIQPAGLYASAERPWQLATPDRLLCLPCPECEGAGLVGNIETFGISVCPECLCKPKKLGALLEAKYLIGGWDGWGEPGTDDIPVYYRAQGLWQADVMEVDEVHFAAWHGAEFRLYRVRRDEKDLRVMRAAGETFMARLADGDPPEIDGHAATIRTLRQLHPDLEDRTAEVAPTLAAGYRRARALKAHAERLLAGFEARLRDQMGNARVAAHDGQKVATRVISEVAESTRTVAAHRRDYLLAPRGNK